MNPQTSLNGTTESYESLSTPVSSITLNKTSSKLLKGQTETLSATVNPSNAANKTLKWTSGNTNIVTVDSNGKVTAVGAGTTTIKAAATDGSGVYRTCTYTIIIPITSITLNKNTSMLHEGQTETLVATVNPSNATNKTLKWTSSNTGVATVDQTGKVTAISKGSAVITAAAIDGSEVKSTCTYTVIDDHGDTAGTATSIALHSKISGKIEVSGDADYFKFTPTTTGTYIFYTTGSTDTKGYLYDSNKTQLAYNDDGGIAGSNFATKYNLTAGQTYYIRVEAYSTKTGPYTFIVTKGVYSASLADDNQDARHVQMQAQASSVLTTLKLHIGSTTYTLNKPASGNLDTTVNGARFKVTFTSASGGLSTVWKIDAKIPSSTTAQTVYFSFSKGKVTDVDSARCV